MKQIGRTARFGCLVVSVSLAAFVAIVVLGIMAQPQLNGTGSVVAASPAPPLPTSVSLLTPTAEAVTPVLATDNGGDLLVVTVVQSSPVLVPTHNPLSEPSPTNLTNASSVPGGAASIAVGTSTPVMITATAFLPYFGGQTLSAQSSQAAMLSARTAWYGALTQGALNYAATLQALGTPTPTSH